MQLALSGSQPFPLLQVVSVVVHSGLLAMGTSSCEIGDECDLEAEGIVSLSMRIYKEAESFRCETHIVGCRFYCRAHVSSSCLVYFRGKSEGMCIITIKGHCSKESIISVAQAYNSSFLCFRKFEVY